MPTSTHTHTHTHTRTHIHNSLDIAVGCSDSQNLASHPVAGQIVFAPLCRKGRGPKKNTPPPKTKTHSRGATMHPSCPGKSQDGSIGRASASVRPQHLLVTCLYLALARALCGLQAPPRPRTSTPTPPLSSSTVPRCGAGCHPSVNRRSTMKLINLSGRCVRRESEQEKAKRAAKKQKKEGDPSHPPCPPSPVGGPLLSTGKKKKGTHASGNVPYDKYHCGLAQAQIGWRGSIQAFIPAPKGRPRRRPLHTVLAAPVAIVQPKRN